MNENPFKILLDAYNDEAENLYDVLIEKVGYNENDNPELKNDIVKSAFAYIIMRYLNLVADYYEHEDFTLFCNEMQFDYNKNYYYFLLGQEQIKWDIDFDEDNDPEAFEIVINTLINHYKNWWSEKLKTNLSNNKIISLFSDEIFGDEPLTRGADMFDKLREFIDEL